MKLNFCTLFDSNFLVLGYTMYISLQRKCRNFHLYIFAFDDLAYNMLKQLELPNVTVISLHEFEDEELLRVKPTRTKGEYCWTCTGTTIKYCIEKYHLEHCTYIEADSYFYADPGIIIRELDEAGKDVLITDHNYTEKHEAISKQTGKYCVQFMVFKNTPKGMEVLNRWRNACIDWCYDRFEDGKFGDQKYLDNWTSEFSCVHVSTLNGAGVAPWNAENYDIVEQSDPTHPLRLVNRKTQMEYDLIFYHFHKFRLYENQVIWERGYTLPAKIIEHIYIPYTNLCLAHYSDLRRINKDIALAPKSSWPSGSFFVKTMYFIIKIFQAAWREKRWVFEKDSYHIYEIKDSKLIIS